MFDSCTRRNPEERPSAQEVYQIIQNVSCKALSELCFSLFSRQTSSYHRLHRQAWSSGMSLVHSASISAVLTKLPQVSAVPWQLASASVKPPLIVHCSYSVLNTALEGTVRVLLSSWPRVCPPFFVVLPLGFLPFMPTENIDLTYFYRINNVRHKRWGLLILHHFRRSSTLCPAHSQ